MPEQRDPRDELADVLAETIVSLALRERRQTANDVDDTDAKAPDDASRRMRRRRR